MGYVRRLLFGKYLVLTNTISCGVMMGIGDVLQQRREQWKRRCLDDSGEFEDFDKFTLTLRQCSTNNFIDDNTNRPMTLANTINVDANEHDIVRTRNMTTIGLMQGPFHHYFYMFLDRFLPGKKAIAVLKKTIVDQTIGSPTCLTIFYFGHEMLEQGDALGKFTEIMEKLLSTYKVDCCFWPPAQLVNFLFIPVQYRVIYINIMNVFYNIFLSCTKYDDE